MGRMPHPTAPHPTALAVAIVASIAIPLSGSLPQDRGAAGTWQKLLKLRTIASVLHTTAHPDDEYGGVLTRLSRGDGARVALLTLTRGESGDNAIGPELFDALGLIRTEELRRADEYYGVDQQYFTTAIDYGFSKRLDEALVKWGRENVLREVVRVIRVEQPLVVISRFQGNDRDGHGNHQTAGLLTQEAYKVAGDASVFADQFAEGVRPWQPLKLYIGGVRENEDWTVRVDSGVYSPWLGESFANFARLGLGFQRSQNSGRIDLQTGPAYTYFRRVSGRVAALAKESSVFDGIDTRLSALFTTLGRPAPAGADAALGTIERHVDDAVTAFTVDDPSACVASLAQGLAATRSALTRLAGDADVTRVLRVKERQFVDAINTALGIDFAAVAQVPGTSAGGPFAPPATMGPAVPGQSFELKIRFTNQGAPPIELATFRLSGVDERSIPVGETLRRDQSATRSIVVNVPASAPPTRPYFHRQSLDDNRYTVVDPALRHRPATPPPFVTAAQYSVSGVPVEIETPVVRREAQLPYGYVTRDLTVAPAVALTVSPRRAIIPLEHATIPVEIVVEVLNNSPAGAHGKIALGLPDGWASDPPQASFDFSRAGERSRHAFSVRATALGAREYEISAAATVEGREFVEGYDVIEHRDLETRYLYRAATAKVRGVDVKVSPGLRVGYVMGVGDEVPAAIAQLGVRIDRLTSNDLATGDLRQFDAVMTGTRAYGVREDLRTYNQRLLDYVQAGGNLIVLYNTPAEFDPAKFAPFPARLPANAEEVSEEDAPVRILAPARPEFTTPNVITRADFEGWVEQRGSKFFSEWDAAYTPLIETHDQGQPPQRGGWVTATYGRGHYTYLAYAFHRQLPFGVPGAYRLLANLLSLSPRR